MATALLATIDFPPARGGVARYIGAIKQTFPNQVQILGLDPTTTTWQAFLKLRRDPLNHDQVWIHHILPLGTAAWLGKLLGGKPYVIFLHGMDFGLAQRTAWKRLLSKLILKSAQAVVTNSQALASEVEKFVKLKRPPLVVYPCLDDALVVASRQPANQQKVNLTKLVQLAVGIAKADSPLYVATENRVKGAITLLTVARLVARKGHLKVLQAISTMPGASYYIVGHGPMLEELQKEVAKLQLNDKVKFFTDVEDHDLPEIYRNADVFVMPTTYSDQDREGFGIAYLEAQAFGLPVIATKHRGVDEAVVDGEGGILIDDKLDSLKLAIERLQDAQLRHDLGKKGRDRVLPTFTREAQMGKLAQLLV